ncbi:hypothetical protein SO802_013294 [Lithocarpus litseifolius]|uniref:Uncharacterized protein n=1 Tax=Lithocarpus litseifolius TaxID=425828 RepID=A0AAW2D578_9ROSI
MGMESEFTRSALSPAKLVMFAGVLVETALEVEVLLFIAVRCEEVVDCGGAPLSELRRDGVPTLRAVMVDCAS